jgi:uncharacterized protein YcbX
VSAVEVARISITPVRTFRLSHPAEVELTGRGVVANRRFMLVDAEGRRLRSSLTVWPVPVTADWDEAAETLRVAIDGEILEGPALGDERLTVDYNGRPLPTVVVDGPWAEPLSRLQGSSVRIVRPDGPGQLQEAPVTLVSHASLGRLEREAGRSVDPRRFRMLFDLAGLGEHEEDTWNGRRVRIGAAVVRVGGGVGRCAVTTRDPDTGERDLDTLRLLRGYREPLEDGEIPFGVYAEVEGPGRVRVGDEVAPI